MPTCAYEHALQHYTAERMVDEYVQAYTGSAGAPGEPHEAALSIRIVRALLDQRLEPWQRAFFAGPGARTGGMGHEVRCYEEIGAGR